MKHVCCPLNRSHISTGSIENRFLLVVVVVFVSSVAVRWVGGGKNGDVYVDDDDA